MDVSSHCLFWNSLSVAAKFDLCSTDTIPTHVLTFNDSIFSNYYRCQHVSVSVS